MKLLADEDFPPSLVSYLQKKRHNIKRIQRTATGVSDFQVREIARKENRIILTFDRDYLSNQGKDVTVSVMRLDYPGLKPNEILKYLDEILLSITNLKRKKKAFIANYSKIGLELIR